MVFAPPGTSIEGRRAEIDAQGRMGQQRDRYDQNVRRRRTLADEYVNRLERGEGSYAEKQMQAGLGQAQRGAMAQAAAGGGSLAQRAALYGGQAAAGQAAAQGAALRAQEMQAARQLQAQMYGNLGREAFEGEMGMRQMAEAMRQSKLNEQYRQKALEAAEAADDKNFAMQIAGLAGTVGGALLAPSDIQAKEGITPIPAADQDALMRNLNVYGYQYKPGLGLPTDQRAGVMAQELARTPLGAQMVTPMRNGMLGIDQSKAAMTNLGLTGRLNERVENLERQQAQGLGSQSLDQAVGDALALRNQGALTDEEAQTMIDGLRAHDEAGRLKMQLGRLDRETMAAAPRPVRPFVNLDAMARRAEAEIEQPTPDQTFPMTISASPEPGGPTLDAPEIDYAPEFAGRMEREIEFEDQTRRFDQALGRAFGAAGKQAAQAADYQRRRAAQLRGGR